MTEYDVEFFRNNRCNVTGFGDGQEFIGWTNVFTDAAGNALFTVAYTNEVVTGEYITATATAAATGDTSEFSACLEVDRVLCRQVEYPADSNCVAVVAVADLDAGTTAPCGGPVTLTANPPGPYPKGTNLVVVTATAPGFTNSCLARVIVRDETPPVLVVPSEMIRTAGPLTTNRVTFFDAPVATDNCSGLSVATLPASGATLSVGTNLVFVTARDSSGNLTNAAFPLIIRPFGVVPRDLAVVGLRAPLRLTLTPFRPSLTRLVTVQIQNRGPLPEIIHDATALASLVNVEVKSLGACPAPVPVLVPPRRFPIILRSKARLTFRYNVTFACQNDGVWGAGHEDYSVRVTLNRAALDGEPDGHPDDDYAPREALPGNVDANPDGRIRDYGVGSRRADRTLGGPVQTDIRVP